MNAEARFVVDLSDAQPLVGMRRIAVCDRCDRRLIGEAKRIAGGARTGYMVCSTQRERHDCEQRGVRSHILEDQVGQRLATLEVPDD